MKLRTGVSWLAGAIAALVLGSTAAAQPQAATVVRLSLPQNEVRAGEQFGVDVAVEDVRGLGAFQFTLVYDPKTVEAVLRGEDASAGFETCSDQEDNDGDGEMDFSDADCSPHESGFLRSTGRQVLCNPPRPLAGVLRFVCVTLGPEPPGPDGSGTLATVTLKAVQEGAANLRLEDVVLATVDAQLIPHSLEGGDLDLMVLPAAEGGNTNWALWGSVIAAVAAVVLVGGLVGWRRARP